MQIDTQSFIIDGLDIGDDATEPQGAGPQPLSQEEIGSIAERAVQDAVDFIASEIAPTRTKSQRYFDGKTDLTFEDGRSGLVSTKVRDTVRAIKPSLMRVFLSSGRYVEYVPNGPEDVAMADQATAYMHWKFQSIGGFRILSDAIHDALVKKIGIVKAYYVKTDLSKVYSYTGLSDEQAVALLDDPDVELIEHSATQEASATAVDGMDPMMQVTPTLHDMKILHKRSKGDIEIVSVPPETFFIDRQARSLDDCYVCGNRVDMRVGDLVAQGYSFEDVSELDNSMNITDTSVTEDQERRGYALNGDEGDGSADKSMRLVTVTEAYMRIDVDNTGIPVLHKITLGGSNYKLLAAEPCDAIPYAIFEVDPEPHAFFGRSLADIVMPDQDATTAILRGVLDNVAMVNNPRLGVVEGQVNLDDVLNNEVGAVVRMRNAGAVVPLAIPFVAGQTMSALQYLDAGVEEKTGVSRASMGLTPDALQSTTKAAVQATVQAAAGQVEVMARNLAEGGMRSLFKLMLALTIKHADAANWMRINGEFKPVDPRVWDVDMDLTVNVGLGVGRDEEKAMAYREILQLQQQVYQQYGPANGVVTLSGMRNTLTDMLALAGIRNSERYFQPITPEIEQQLAAQAAQAAQGKQQPVDPNQAFLQAEQMKAQQRIAIEQFKAQEAARKAVMDDDLKRDQMAQDLAIKDAELAAKYGVEVDKLNLQREQNMQRILATGPQIQGGM
jgi:hypothetical protein